MNIEWEAYPLTLLGKENGDIVVCIQGNPPDEACALNGYAEVWVGQRGGKVHGAQFYADGDDVEELKRVLLEWREKFKAMMEEA